MSGTWMRNPRPGNTENADAYRRTQRNQDPRRPRRTGAGGGRRPGQARPRGVAAEGRGREVRFPRRGLHRAGREEIGRAHVWTPVTNAHLVCRLLLEKKKDT